jgi:hypothetical protein
LPLGGRLLPFLFEFSNASTLAILASRPIWLMVIDPNSSQKQGVRQAKQLKKGPQFSAPERLNLLICIILRLLDYPNTNALLPAERTGRCVGCCQPI